MTKKEIVDNYIKDQFLNIQDNKSKTGFRWQSIANDLNEVSEEAITGEYVRGRFRDFVKDNCLKTECTKENCVCKGLTIAVDRTNNTYNHLESNTKLKYFYSEDRDKGTAKLEDSVVSKLSDEDIYIRYSVDQSKYKISAIYYKDQSEGFRMTVLFRPIFTKDNPIDYLEEFDNFIIERNLRALSINTDKFWQKDPLNKELDCTVVINTADLHLGKLVSEQETGERYNLDIAKKRFLDCVKYLAIKSYQCYGVKKFILSTLGDTLHTDSLKSTTTAGTYVESDTRASKVFQTALELISDGIEILKQYAPEVEFININGNHCELSEQHLGIALKAYYRSDSQVFINSEPRNRKYKLIGENLLAWSHGDSNMNTLPLTIATEVPELWGKSKFRMAQIGHLHTSKKKVFQAEDEFNGVIVRHFSSLSGVDAWHDKNNFTSAQKRGTALVFSDKEVGILGEFYKTV